MLGIYLYEKNDMNYIVADIDDNELCVGNFYECLEYIARWIAQHKRYGV